MTKKDYELIAEVLNISFSSFRNDLKELKIKDRNYILSKGASEAIKIVSEALALRLAQENPKFDEQRFLKACSR